MCPKVYLLNWSQQEIWESKQSSDVHCLYERGWIVVAWLDILPLQIITKSNNLDSNQCYG